MKRLWMAAMALVMAAWAVPTWACGGGCGGGFIIYREDRIDVEGPNNSAIPLKIVDWSETSVSVELPADMAEAINWDGRIMELRLTKSASPGWVDIHWPQTKIKPFTTSQPVILDQLPWLFDYAMANYPKALVDHQLINFLAQCAEDRRFGIDCNTKPRRMTKEEEQQLRAERLKAHEDAVARQRAADQAQDREWAATYQREKAEAEARVARNRQKYGR